MLCARATGAARHSATGSSRKRKNPDGQERRKGRHVFKPEWRNFCCNVPNGESWVRHFPAVLDDENQEQPDSIWCASCSEFKYLGCRDGFAKGKVKNTDA